MDLPGHFYFFIISCSVLEFYKRFLRSFVGFLFVDCAQTLKLLNQNRTIDFGCGFFLFGCFSKLWNLLVLVFVFGLGLNALQFRCHFKDLIRCVGQLRGKSTDWGAGFCLNRSGELEMGRDWGLQERNGVVDSNGDLGQFKDDDFVGGDDEERREVCDEDEMFDLLALRKLVKVQRRRADAAWTELDKERMAAASAAEEAMAMILRLQNDKSLLQIRVTELQRLAEEKQVHDHEVIQSLQWIIMEHESERSLLEDQLRFCGEKLKLYEKVDEGDLSDCVTPTFSASSPPSRLDGLLISSLDLDLPPRDFRTEHSYMQYFSCRSI
ncbi:hypothetical protein Dimus_003016 [Dionaea muscipula]